MTQSQGWIKILRNIRYKFSHNQSINYDLWNLYVFLYEKAAWDDTRELNKGQLKINVSQIKEEWMFHLYVTKIHRLLERLQNDGYIKMTKLSKINQQGYLIEICHYDQFVTQNEENLCETSVKRVSNDCETTSEVNDVESLDNRCAENEQCETSVKRVSNDCETSGCSYIEERKKNKNEELNTTTAADEQHRTVDDDLILDDQSKKTKKPKKEKPIGKSVAVINAYQEAFFERYHDNITIDAAMRKQACLLIDRVGQEDAVNVVKFYLTHNDRWYLKKAHDIKYCLLDCKKLCLEMRRDLYITDESITNYLNNAKAKSGKFRV
jgi:hypothetical protein